MRKEILIAPRNSVILVTDQSIGTIPTSMHESLVSATQSCVAVGTLLEHDGETLISLSDETIPLGDAMSLVFDGVLETPTKKLSLCSVCDETLATLDVPTENTRVQIWTNDSEEPDQIHVVAVRWTE